METGNRVQEIRRRFEGLNSEKNDSYVTSPPQLRNEEASSSVTGKLNDVETHAVKSGIKRSHAFRSDKSKVKPLIANSKPSSNLLSGKAVSIKECKSDVLPNNNLVYAKALKTSNLSLPRTSIHNIRAPPPSIKVDVLSDTLKKALKNPLPPGPAPKKPPRTFAHFKSVDLEDGQRKIQFSETLSRFEPPSANENSVVLKNKAALSQRSKTEPHIMLKKLESALLNNQANRSISTIRSEPPGSLTKKQEPNKFSSFGAKTLCLNGFSSCLNKNIYDTPFEYKHKAELPIPKKSVSPSKGISYGKIHKVVGSPHIYEEPYSPKSERKLEEASKNNFQVSNHSRKPSVHYMSSPVCEAKKALFQNVLVPISSFQDKGEKIKMITDAFNDNAPSDSDRDSVQEDQNGNQEEVTAVRKTYAQRVSSMRRQVKHVVKRENLFEALLLIGIDQHLTLGKVPYIKMKFPETAELVRGLIGLVFPDASDWPPSEPGTANGRRRHHNYTLTLTGDDGSRRYAYCRRLRPEGAPFCLPLAYALVTPHKDNVFYYSILAELETRHGEPENEFLQFAKSLYYSHFPRPGFNIKIGDSVFLRPIDPRRKSYDISTLLQGATIPVFIKIFSTLLIERKVIIIGSNISVVSDCIEGLQKALFPFEWEHTLVGAVPPTLLELCEAPTPFLMGVIRPKGDPQSANFLPLRSMDDCLVADVESGDILVSCGDEGSLLPSRLSACLRSALSLCPSEGTDLAPSEALMRLFVELVGHYNSHVVTSLQTNTRTFQRETFVKAPKSRSAQHFLDWFTETAMFQSFIQKRLERSFEPGIFEQRCAEFIEENIKNHNVSKKEKSLNKTVKILGDRFKDWASSS